MKISLRSSIRAVLGTGITIAVAEMATARVASIPYFS